VILSELLKYLLYYVCEYIFCSLRIMVRMIAYTNFFYCLNNINCLVLSFVCVNLFVLFPSFARACFINGLRAVEQARI
jgi:hypothetical protein